MKNEEDDKTSSYDGEETSKDSDSESDSCYDMGRPSLLKQLQVILDEYPDNSQIIRELIQNAEDAGASEMKLFHDEEQTVLPEGNLYAKYFRAPALCVYNDALFTAKDWDGIGTIYDSNKQKDPLKVGRFGLGFKSVFHLTDHPVIISGKKLLIIDPCKGKEECIPVPLKKVNDDGTISRALEPIIGNFGFTKDSVREKNYNGTLFWFPLRKKASQLSKNIYTSDKVKILIKSFETEASLTLLFLRNTKMLQIYTKVNDEIVPDITVENLVDKGNSSKEEFYTSIQRLGNKIPPANLVCHFQCRVVLQKAQQSPEEAKWAITCLFKGKDGMSEDLEKLIVDTDLSYSPLVGIAVPLSRENQSQNSRPFGHVFSVLPLPMQNESLTGFPVHVNGFFSLGQNRKNVKWPTSSEQHVTDKCIQWNRALCRNVLVDAYVSCIEFLKEITMETGRITSENNLVYQALPDPEEIHSDWTFLIDPLYRSLLGHEIFLTENNGGRWISLDDSIFAMFEWIMPSKEYGLTIENTVVEILLQQYGQNIVHIPKHVEHVLSYGQDVRKISPRMVRGILQETDAYKDIKQTEKLDLCKFVLSDIEENADEVTGLELLPLRDQSFETFTEYAQTIYHCIEEEDHMMFPNLDMKFSDFSDFDEDSKERINGMIYKGFYQLKTFQEDMVPELLSETLKKNGKTDSQFFTATSGKLTEDWLKRIWRFIADRFVCLDKFEQVHIIPYNTRETFLRVSGNYMLHKSPGVQELSEETVQALSALSITVVKDLPSFINHPDVRQKYFKPPTVQSLMELLHNLLRQSSDSIECFNKCSIKERMSFANFLEGDLGEIKSASKEVIQILKSLKMFQQSGYGSPENVLVSVKDNAYVACREDFPFTFPKPFLSLKTTEIANILGAEQCSWRHVVQEMLKLIVTRPTEQEMSDENVRQFMDYFVQHISYFEDDEEHLQIAKQIPFVPTLSNGFQKPMDLFDPMDKTLQTIFAYLPNSFPIDSHRDKQTLKALRCLGLKLELSESDAIDVIHSVTKDENKDKKKMKVNKSEEMNYYICKTLLSLLCDYSQNALTKPFVETVHDLEWVPCQTTNPENYPDTLPWNRDRLLCKPDEVFALRYHNLAGSSACMVDVNINCNLSKLFGWDIPPPPAVVTKQLQIFIEKCSHDRVRFDILQDIYSYFESSDIHQIKNILQDTRFVYAESGFRSPTEVFIDFPENVEMLSLAPYMYTLKEFRTMETIFVKLGCSEQVNIELLVNILTQISSKHEHTSYEERVVQQDLNMALTILERLSKLDLDGFDLGKVLVPIHTSPKTLLLKPAPVCTFCSNSKFYDNMEIDSDDEEEDLETFIVHRDVHISIIKALKIESVTKRYLSDQGVEILESCGQSESLTTRLSNLLEDYGDGFAVLKELIQNAEDAGASKISFMYDERQNKDLRSKVIENMGECQGPALWVYNNGMFEEKDFRNIQKLGGRTKEADRDTIGKFGLGFCSVYNLTDVPSFISGNSMVIFDPHASYLVNAIGDKANPGIKINIQSNSIFKKYFHQFQVFNGVFGCKFRNSPRHYKGTLFRLPLRTQEQAARSEIAKLCYNKQEMLQLLQKLENSLGDLLIFTQNLKQIELWHLGENETNPEKAVLVFGTHKNVHSTLPPEMKEQSIVRAAGMNLDEFHENEAKQIEVHQEIDIKVFSRNTFLRKSAKQSNMRWRVSWSSGRKNAREMAVKMAHKGALPLGSVAIALNEKSPKMFPFKDSYLGFCKRGHLFCFLPLPQESSLPVHVNGCFAVSNDRKQIRRATDDDKSTLDSSWNDVLISDPICEAFVNLLVQLNQRKEKPGNDYSLLWPKYENTSSAVMASIPLILESFYTNLVKHDPRVFYNCRNVHASFSECIFLDNELRSNKKVGNAAFNCLLKCYGKKGKKGTVMDMTEAVFFTFIKLGLQDDLQNKTITTFTFYKKIFLPNIQKVTDKQERDGLVLFAINHQDKQLKSLLKQFACVPTLPREALRKPEDLVRPNSEISTLFDENDQRLVSGTKTTFRSETVLDVLESLGMMHDTLSEEFVIERAKSVSKLATRNEQVDRCKTLLAYLRKDKDVLPDLSSIEFLPFSTRPKNWPLVWLADIDRHQTKHDFKSPQDLFLEQTKWLVGCTKYVVDSEIIGPDTVSELLLTLGCSDECNVVTNDVLQQLQAVSNIAIATLSKQSLEELKHLTDRVYNFLNNRLSNGEEIDLSLFYEKPVVFVSDQLILPKYATMGLLYGFDCKPVIYKVTKIYKLFFKAIGVRDNLTTVDVVNIICHLQSNYAQQHIKQLNDAQIKLHSNLLQLLVNINRASDDDIQTTDIDRVMLPDVESVLRHAKDLCTDDGYTTLMRHDYIHFVNDKIPFSVYKLLNIKSKRQQHLFNISCAMPFGQEEELVTRIRGILDNYPMGHSILNELLQNADDAGASEIHFILDQRNHGDSGIFGDSWEDLQGPALCVYNNSCFTEKDLEGICSLGKGSKSNDPTKTGQFGIGFNAVYHITDAPSFISKGKNTPNGGTFCVLDPHCKYCPTAMENQPGMQIPDLKALQDNYPGVYNCYLQRKFKKNQGTWFRFPLRSPAMAAVSKLSDKSTLPEDIEELFNQFRIKLITSLLFLKDIRKVTLSSINIDGEMKMEYSVSTKINVSAKRRQQKFSQNCNSRSAAIKAGDMSLNEVAMEQVSYSAYVTDSDEESQRWIITQVFGSSPECEISDHLIDLVKNGDIGLMPKGGVALNISEEHSIEVENGGYDTYDAFCSLPLSIKTGLPVHINGIFALDPSRRYIKTDNETSGRWNQFILGNIIPLAYVKALETLRNTMFQKIPGSGCYYTELRGGVMESYHGYFPLYETLKSDMWKDTVTQIYKIIVAREVKLFPVLQETSVWWVSLMTTGHKFPAYFDNLFEILLQNTVLKGISGSIYIEKSQKEAKDLLRILKGIGMKIIDTPLSVYETMQAEVINGYKSEVSQQFQTLSASAILKFLISSKSTMAQDGCSIEGLGSPIEGTPFQSIAFVKMIIKFLLGREPELFSELLPELPLLVTNDMTLNRFRDVNSVYLSKFCELLPKSSEHFVAEGLVIILESAQKRDSSILKHLKLVTFCEMLPKNLNRWRLEQTKPIQWTVDSELPTSKWIQDFWFYLDSLDKSELSFLEKYLGKWCLVPAECKMKNAIEYQLVPINLAYSVLDLDTFKKPKEHFSSLGVPSIRSMVYSDTLRNTVASAERPMSVLKSLYYHKEILSNGENTMKETVLYWLNKKLDKITKITPTHTSIKEMLRSLPLYLTISGNVTTLNRKLTKILILKENKFEDWVGIDEWAKQCNYVLLCDKHANGRIEMLLGANVIDIEAFYIYHFLPNFQYIDTSFHLKHLEYIKSNLLIKKLTQVLESVQFVPSLSGLKTAGFFFNPHIRLCSVMCSQDQLPPEPFNNKDWEEFMVSAGMKTEVTGDMLKEFALEIQLQGQQGISNDIRRKSREILCHLFNRENLVTEGILSRIRDIRFIVPCKVSKHLLKIAPQVEENTLINFASSVSYNCQQLVWSTMSILPEHADPALQYVADLSEIQRQLCINVIPPIIPVVSHVHNVCTSLKEEANQNVLEEDRIQKLMDTIYAYLQTHGQSQEAKTGLSETPFVLIPDQQCLVKATQVVENILQQHEIPPFLMKFPLRYGRYVDLFKYYGGTVNATLAQYAQALKCFYNDSTQGYLLPIEQENAGRALTCFLELLSGRKEEDIENEMKDIEHLYLINDRSARRCMKSTDMIVPDNKTFRKRLKHKKIWYVHRYRDNGIYKKMPLHLQPKYLSSIVDECLFSDDNESIHDEMTDSMQQLLHSTDFRRGVNAIRKKSKNTITGDADMSDRLKSINIRCVSDIVTILLFQGNAVKESTQSVDCFVDNNCSTILVKKGNCGDHLNSFLKVVKDPLSHYICKICSVTDDSGRSEIKELLYYADDLNGLRSHVQEMTNDDEEENTDSWCPELGSYVPIHLHSLLDNAFNELEVHEIVAYEVWDSVVDAEEENENDQIFIFSKIKRKNFSGQKDILDQEYCIDIGEYSLEDVHALKLYRFIRKPTETCTDLVLFTDGRKGASRLNEDAIFKQIRQTLINAWKHDKSVRKRVVKRLLLRWHPDKNSDCQELSKEVTQYIFDIIRKLENGETVDGGTQTGNHSYGNRREPQQQPFRESSDSCQQWQAFGDRMGSRTYSNYQFSFNDTPNPQPREARRWLKQAKLDLKAANAAMRGANHEKVFNWICFQCHQACEKALKAAGITQDMNMVKMKSHNLIGINSNLSLEIEETIRPAVIEFESLVRSYSTMRYPDKLAYPSVPGDIYTKEQATRALELAAYILDQISDSL